MTKQTKYYSFIVVVNKYCSNYMIIELCESKTTCFGDKKNFYYWELKTIKNFCLPNAEDKNQNQIPTKLHCSINYQKKPKINFTQQSQDDFELQLHCQDQDQNRLFPHYEALLPYFRSQQCTLFLVPKVFLLIVIIKLKFFLFQMLKL